MKNGSALNFLVTVAAEPGFLQYTDVEYAHRRNRIGLLLKISGRKLVAEIAGAYLHGNLFVILHLVHRFNQRVLHFKPGDELVPQPDAVENDAVFFINGELILRRIHGD